MSENRSSSPGVKDNAESSASPRSEDVLRSIGLNVCAEVTPPPDCVRKPCTSPTTRQLSRLLPSPRPVPHSPSYDLP